MCGIAGFSFEDKALIKKMMDLISHRGPDDHDHYTDNFVSLGHQRLSVLDLTKNGRQPMINEKGNLLIVHNGEIFNYLELRKKLEQKGYQFKSNTDTEVILNAYDAYGKDCVSLFNGQFAFVIYDLVNKIFFGARDRLGIKPFYYTHQNGKFIFCSEMKGILIHPLLKKINLESLNKFITLRYIPTEETILKGIKRLLPAHYFTYDLKQKNPKKRLHIQRYWDLSYTTQHKSEAWFAQELRRQLTKSIERRLISDVPLGVYLSGGLDSSAIVGLLSSLRDEIKTFSVGFGYGDHIDEVKHAKVVSDHFQTDHKEFLVTADLMKTLPKIVWHLDQPIADPASLPVYLLSQKVKKHVTVVLSGQGGDELFAGYEQNKFLLHRNKLKFIPKPIRSALAKTVHATPEQILTLFFRFAPHIGKQGRKRFCNYIKHIDNKAQAYLEIMSVFNNQEKKELFTEDLIKSITEFDLAPRINKMYYQNNLPYLNQILHYEVKEPLPENLLIKNDNMVMASAVEERVPLLDHTFVAFAASIPPQLKLHHMRHEKYIFKKAMQSVLPRSILQRKKQRFYVPIDLWLQRDDIKALVDDLLSPKHIKQQGYFNYDYIKKIRKQYGGSRLFYARQLWNLLHFQLWHKVYLEEGVEKRGKVII